MGKHPALRALLLLLGIVTGLCAAATCVAAEGLSFPLRGIYPEVPVISTTELLHEVDRAIVVDIRSRMEYDVAHVNGAVLLPLGQDGFAEQLGNLRPKDGLAPLVFYCNGHTCEKSYQATELAMSLGYVNVFAYDGGIFDWITSAPDRATLMGATPADAERVISNAEFNSHTVDYARFAELAASPNALVVDIRDPFQRETVPRLDDIRNIALDPLLQLITSQLWQEKKLLFFDAVGRQVRWLQYYLESFGYFDYAFLKGGVLALERTPDALRPVFSKRTTLTCFQPQLLEAASSASLDARAMRTLFALLGELKFGNYSALPLDELSARLGMSDGQTMDAVMALTASGLIAHKLTQGNLVYTLDPALCWKGNPESARRTQAVKQFREKVNAQ